MMQFAIFSPEGLESDDGYQEICHLETVIGQIRVILPSYGLKESGLRRLMIDRGCVEKAMFAKLLRRYPSSGLT